MAVVAKILANKLQKSLKIRPPKGRIFYFVRKNMHILFTFENFYCKIVLETISLVIVIFEVQERSYLMNVEKKFGKGAEMVWYDRKRICGLPLSFTRYYLIKNQNIWFKVFIDIGLTYTQIEEVNLYRMFDVSLRQSLFDKFFGTGTVTLYSNDERSPRLVLKNIKNPFQVRDMFSQLIEEQRKLHNVQIAEFQT